MIPAPSPACGNLFGCRHEIPGKEAVYNACRVMERLQGNPVARSVARHCREATGTGGYRDLTQDTVISESALLHLILTHPRENERADAIRKALETDSAPPLFGFRTSGEIEAALSSLAIAGDLFTLCRNIPHGRDAAAFLRLLLRLHHERARLKALEENPPSAAVSLRRAARSAAACLKSLTRRGLPEAVRHAAALMDAVLDLCRVEVKRLAEESNALRRAVNFTEPTNRLR